MTKKRNIYKEEMQGKRMQEVMDLLAIYKSSCTYQYMDDNFYHMHAHEVRTSEGLILFYSYTTLVAAYDCYMKIYWYGSHTFSTTTAKQLTRWTGVNTANRRKEIKEGAAMEFDNFRYISIC